MSYTSITKPAQGDALRKSLADALIDNDAYFLSIISGLTGLQVPNGSFEIHTVNEPAAWELSRSGTAGTYAISGSGLTDTNCNHGRRAIKITSVGGGANGGYYLQNADYIECSPNRPLIVSLQLYSAPLNVTNRVEVLFYTAAQTYISQTSVYASIANPTAWTLVVGSAIPPATARYCKLRLTGCETGGAVAGSTWFDDVRLFSGEYSRQVVIDGIISPPTSNVTLHYWTAPVGVYLADFELFGAGGKGGASSASTGNGGGGGSGGYSRAILPVIPGTQYAITLAGSNSTAANSTVVVGATTLLCGGGGPGGAGVGVAHGPAGVAGTASGGTINSLGSAGVAGSNTPPGGYGGMNVYIGVQTGLNGDGEAGLAASPGTCAGGSGALGDGAGSEIGGVGATSRLIIRY